MFEEIDMQITLIWSLPIVTCIRLSHYTPYTCTVNFFYLNKIKPAIKFPVFIAALDNSSFSMGQTMAFLKGRSRVCMEWCTCLNKPHIPARSPYLAMGTWRVSIPRSWSLATRKPQCLWHSHALNEWTVLSPSIAKENHGSFGAETEVSHEEKGHQYYH